ncbi:unannotated protein [freshwater metagenome]|uniref:Unannotated protein n=1 Tax=freshwater metagenome TaxID=449393 RepID=A0A6J6PMW3_9ZZZZ
MTSPADWRAYGDEGLSRILAAALDAFAEQGYHGTSIRDIAAGAGLSVPGVYHHHESKQQILLALMMTTMDDLLDRSRAAVAGAGDAPGAEFDALVEHLLRFHMVRRRQAFVGSTEIRSLEPAHRAAYVERRDEQQRMVEHAIEAGVGAGVFTTPYVRDAARAVSSLCVGVASWYREDGPDAATDLVVRHLSLARGLVGAAR